MPRPIKNIAFFAPIKPPDHAIPSGDRLIAGNLVKALKQAGFAAELASRYICYSKRSAVEILEDKRAGALEEAERLVSRYEALSKDERPQVWLTYHPYCKAPDWIGPRVSSALSIPYVTVEAAKTGQGENDEWKPWREEAQSGIRSADLHLCFKPTDRTYLTELLGGDDKIVDFPAFLDTDTISGNRHADAMPRPVHWDPGHPVLVTAGMMRPGKKVRNFELLAETVSDLQDQQWNMVVIGGGPMESAIRKLFDHVSQSRLHWTGQIEQAEVLAWMTAADCFIWPGWREPIGMVYLEAQLQGLPVIASRSMGVPLVVENGVSGLLSPEDDAKSMRANLQTLLRDENMRRSLGNAARKKVLRDHSLEAASKRLQQVLSNL